MYQKPKEVIDLARLRFDRRSGPGAFAESEALVFSPDAKDGGKRRVADVLDKIGSHTLDTAERDIRDVVEAIPGLVPPAGSSGWLKAIMSHAPDSQVEEPGSLVFLNEALSIVRTRMILGAYGGWAVLTSPDGRTIDHGEILLARSLADAVLKLERTIRKPGVEECAVAVELELRSDADIGAMRGIARTLGIPFAPAGLLVCMLGHRDGTRVSVVLPVPVPGNDSPPIFLTYCDEGPIEAAYVAKGALGQGNADPETPARRVSSGLAEQALGHIENLSETWSAPRVAVVRNEGDQDWEQPPLRGDAERDPSEIPPLTAWEAVEAVQRNLMKEGVARFALATPLRPRSAIDAEDLKSIRRMFPGPGMPDLIYLAVAGCDGGPLAILGQTPGSMNQFTPTIADLELLDRAYEPAAGDRGHR